MITSAGTPKKRALFWFKLFLAVALIGVLIYKVGAGSLLSEFKSISYSWSLLTLIYVWVLFYVQGAILGLIARKFAVIPQKDLYVFTLVGRFFSLFMPSSVGGDFVKAYYLAPYYSSGSQCLATILLHRLVGGVATVAVGLLAGAIFLPDKLAGYSTIAFGAFSLSLIVGWMIYVKYPTSFHNSSASGYERPETLKDKLAVIITALLSYRQQKSLLIIAFLLSVIGTALNALLFVLVSRSLGMGYSFPLALVASSATVVMALLPFTRRP